MISRNFRVLFYLLHIYFMLVLGLSGIRWAIEQCFEEAKTEIGMDHYEVRKLPGWVHHMMTSMLAHFFLWHIKLRLGKKSTSSYAVAA
jgi:SRSO17 transposase